MAWSSKLVCSCKSGDVICGDDNGAFVHLFNENTSMNGHAMMSIEYSDGKCWGLSFEPADPDAPMKEKILGTPAKIVDRTGWQSEESGVIGQVADYVATYVISEDQKNSLGKEIAKEKASVGKGEVSYALMGKPIYGIFLSGYRDTCYSWTVRVLRQAGVISPVWQASRWLSVAPASAWSYSGTKPQWRK